MATVLAGTTFTDPSILYPEKYKSCFWNFVTGWQCETIDTPPPSLPPVYSPPPETSGEPSGAIPLGTTPDPNASPAMLPAYGCGCCGSNAAILSSPISGAAGSSLATVPTLSGEVSATGKNCVDCKCGYSNREAMLAVAVALAFFLLVRK